MSTQIQFDPSDNNPKKPPAFITLTLIGNETGEWISPTPHYVTVNPYHIVSITDFMKNGFVAGSKVKMSTGETWFVYESQIDIMEKAK